MDLLARRRSKTPRDSHKIFGVGHGRTGTRTLVTALEVLGYRLLHHASRVQYSKLNRCDGGTDNAFAARFVELDEKYPGSKFIYTVRSLESWLDSCRRNIPKKKPCKVGSPKHEVRVRMFGYDQGLGYKEDLLIEAFKGHRARVEEYFKDRPDDLLFIDIIGGEGWEKLCPFLNEPIPAVDFPHEGRGKRGPAGPAGA